MAYETVSRCRNKKSDGDSTEVYSTNLSRKRLYWLCENWQRKDGSLRFANSSETLRRPVRYIRCGSHPHQVKTCYVGDQCSSSCECKLLNVLRFLTCRLPFLWSLWIICEGLEALQLGARDHIFPRRFIYYHRQPRRAVSEINL